MEVLDVLSCCGRAGDFNLGKSCGSPSSEVCNWGNPVRRSAFTKVNGHSRLSGLADKPGSGVVKMSLGHGTMHVSQDSEEHQAMEWLRQDRTGRGHVMAQPLHREVCHMCYPVCRCAASPMIIELTARRLETGLAPGAARRPRWGRQGDECDTTRSLHRRKELAGRWSRSSWPDGSTLRSILWSSRHRQAARARRGFCNVIPRLHTEREALHSPGHAGCE